MHLLETYALNCGAKIDKPYIYEQYYPLGEEKYITIQPYSRYAGKQYVYWAEVINYIFPYLEKEKVIGYFNLISNNEKMFGLLLDDI